MGYTKSKKWIWWIKGNGIGLKFARRSFSTDLELNATCCVKLWLFLYFQIQT